MFAEVQSGVLVPCFLLAAIVVAPFGLHQVRRVRAQRAAIEAANAPPPEPTRFTRPRLEDVVASIELAGSGRVSGRNERDDGTTAQIVVPKDVTVDDRDVAPQVVDALVRDALRRSSLVATAERDTLEGRVIECRRVESAS
ncbi:MAG: hypothetical protein ACHQDC_07015 [Acidimicrobiales bacterium]